MYPCPPGTITLHGKTVDEIAELVQYANDNGLNDLIKDIAILRRRCYHAEGLIRDLKRIINETEL